MAQNKVQYQRGLPMLEFFDLYGSHERCEDAIRGWRWPEGFVCPRRPRCQGSWHSEFRRQDRLYFQCSACRYQCSVLSGTIFESSKFALPKWFLAMHLMTQAKKLSVNSKLSSRAASHAVFGRRHGDTKAS